jgi:dTDP-4-dehydrorhamnose reductase
MTGTEPTAPNAGRILVTGATGQVGRALSQLLGERAIAIGHEEADFSRPETLPAALDRFRPSAIINPGAYTQVDQAEREEERARLINAEAPGVIARWCARNAVPLIHYSTDYVFSGEGTRPWEESDPVGPLNAYGRTKLAGERAIAEAMGASGAWMIFRTSWVYDATGKNFVRTMLRLGAEKEQLRIVADQHGAPTYALHLARATLSALETAQGRGPDARAPDARFPSGIYHLCNAGETSWLGFAERIFARARELGIPLKVKTVEPTATASYPTPAPRPLNSRLNTGKARRELGLALPDWEQGLQECLELIASSQGAVS